MPIITSVRLCQEIDRHMLLNLLSVSWTNCWTLQIPPRLVLLSGLESENSCERYSICKHRFNVRRINGPVFEKRNLSTVTKFPSSYRGASRVCKTNRCRSNFSLSDVAEEEEAALTTFATYIRRREGCGHQTGVRDTGTSARLFVDNTADFKCNPSHQILLYQPRVVSVPPLAGVIIADSLRII